MTTKGIIFSAPMVRALLAGTKTQTRRLVTPAPRMFTPEYDKKWRPHVIPPAGSIPDQWSWWEGPSHGPSLYHTWKSPYSRGDRLYVREAWTVRGRYTDVVEVGYRAHKRESHTEYVEQWPVDRAVPGKGKWPTWPKYGPSIHMPRWASRLWLDVTEVRVQRLQDISEADAIAEGTRCYICGTGAVDGTSEHDCGCFHSRSQAIPSYQVLWNSLHTEPGTRWDDNPWVVAVSFEVHHGNVDEVAHV